jgi:four helix bundle protein
MDKGNNWKKEAKETYYWLQIITESGLLKNEDIELELKECNEIISILSSSIKSAKKRSV